MKMGSEELARKIAELLETERPANDLSAIKASIDSINSRLTKLESMGSQIPISAMLTQHSHHPSLDKLAIAEAIADQIFGGEGKEKACTFEPNGKPCDHCGMCSSRGF
jgi:hypothetical protein